MKFIRYSKFKGFDVVEVAEAPKRPSTVSGSVKAVAMNAGGPERVRIFRIVDDG